jgi:hypothetical protein
MPNGAREVSWEPQGGVGMAIMTESNGGNVPRQMPLGQARVLARQELGADAAEEKLGPGIFRWRPAV